MVKSMEIVSEEHAQLNEIPFILIIVCKYIDYLTLRKCEHTNARLSLRPQPKRRCVHERAIRAPVFEDDGPICTIIEMSMHEIAQLFSALALRRSWWNALPSVEVVPGGMFMASTTLLTDGSYLK